MKQKCPNCRYAWDYKGKSKYYCTCPQCLRKVKVVIGQHEAQKRV